MLIKCKLHRPGGTRIHFGTGKERVEYHFKPRDKNAKDDDPRVDHVADVNNKEHIGRLLGIAEGYEVDDSEVTAPSAKPASERIAAVAAETLAASEPVPPAGASSDISKMDRKQLLAAVEKKLGKRPNPATSTAKLKSILAEPAKS